MNHPIDLPQPDRKFLPVLPRYEPSTKDSTAVKTFKECPRKYFYRFVLGRKKPDAENASIFAWGTAVHKFLEILYSTNDVALALQEALKLYRFPTKDKFAFQTKERFTAMCIAMFKRYEEEKNKRLLEVIAIEQPFSIKFPDGEDVGGRWDQLVKWNGRIWIRDWKTTSKQLNYWKKELEPNDQATRYIYATSCLQYGQDSNGYPNKLIEGVLFVAIYNAKTVENTIENVPSSRNMFQIRKWVDDQMMLHKHMNLCRAEDIWPQNESNCGWCDYQIICNAPSEASMMNTLKTQYILEPWKMEETEQKEVKEA